ncbi:TetR/AcrR family transcriptional regulator [Virgibacillus oceani]
MINKGEQTKTFLISATRELIMENGCSKLTFKRIMERTNLSKGAIYHHVKNKNQLLALVLLERNREINSRFFSEVDYNNPKLDGPLEEILANIPSLSDPDEVSNQIFFYLLSQIHDSEVAEVLQQLYEQSYGMSKTWIKEGQENYVISKGINADSTAELFTMLTYGLRVRSMISGNTKTDVLSGFIKDYLNKNK